VKQHPATCRAWLGPLIVERDCTCDPVEVEREQMTERRDVERWRKEDAERATILAEVTHELGEEQRRRQDCEKTLERTKANWFDAHKTIGEYERKLEQVRKWAKQSPICYPADRKKLFAILNGE
jgi:hypothetical protein